MTRKHLTVALFIGLLVPVLSPGTLFGQSTGTGEISGTVVDESGAVVPGVAVIATHEETGLSRRTVSNASGAYVIPALPVGQYKIEAQITGFRTFLQKGVIVETDAKIALNIVLQPGSVRQEITVVGTPPPLQTQSGEVSTLVSGEQVKDLALDGRNFTQLLTLGAGVTSSQEGRRMGVGQEGNPLMSINGGRINSTKFTYDGTLAMDTGGNRGLNLFPAMEAIQEIRIKKSNYSADSGSYGFGEVNVVTKSGGKNFHGDLYEYLGNDALDARNFFDNEVSPFKQNNFGYTIGGPFFIPGKFNDAKNKTFFFWSQSWNRRRGPQLVSFTSPPTGVFTATTPSAAMRSGDFREILPQTIKDPNTGQPFMNNMIQPQGIDPNAALLLATYYPLPNRAGVPNYVASPNAATNWREEMFRIDQYLSEKNTLMVRYAHDSWEQHQAVLKPSPSVFPTVDGIFRKPGQNLVTKLTTIFNPTTLNEFTVGFSMNKITQLPGPLAVRPTGLTIQKVFPANPLNVIPDINLAQGFGNIGVGGLTNNANPVFTFRDDLSHQINKHSLKMGFEFLRIDKFGKNFGNLQGSFNFNAGATGNAVADFLLGKAFNYTEQAPFPHEYLFANDYEMYFQDDWRVRPDLTLNLGLRWNIMAAAPNGYEKFDQISEFVPGLYDPSKAPTVIRSSGQLVPGTGDPLNGIITPTNQKGLSLPESLSQTRYVMPGPRFGFAWSPRGNSKTVLRGGYGIFYHWDNNNHENLSQNPPFAQSVNISNTSLSNPASVPGSLFPPNLAAFDFQNLYPMVQQWSLGVQRELPAQTVLSVAYVGNHAVHLDQTININQPWPGSVTGGANVNALRPFPGYGNINYDERSASAHYNALQVGLKRRFQGGWLVEAAYTYSKALTRGAGQDILQKSEQGLSDMDRSHAFTINYVYQLPFFKEQQSGIGKVLGGWEFSGITTFQSGFPFMVTIPGDRAQVGSGTQRPDLVGKITYPKQLDQWFDTSVFVPGPMGRFGNEGSNVVRGPGINNWSMNFYKNTPVHFKDRTVATQFGAEFFNVFNHPSFAGVGASFGSSTFGHVTAALDPRIVQLRLKISY